VTVVTLVAAATNGLTVRAAIVIIALWVVTGIAATAAGHQQYVQRLSQTEKGGEHSDSGDAPGPAIPRIDRSARRKRL
jgi:hypothetical protein